MASGLVEITEESAFNALMTASKSNNSSVLLFFWASWHEPSKQMKMVLQELASDTPDMKFLAIDAEELSDISSQFPVQSVPTFVVTKGGKITDTLEGASAPKLVSLVQKAAKAAQVSTARTTQASAQSQEDLNARLAKLVRAAPVMLFMKGTPEEPKCGFSRTIIGILKEHDAKFGYFDILTDDAVRQGLKTYSNWKTYPQLYAKGELIGGLDIIKEMQEEGELAAVFPEPPTEMAINARLKELVKQSPVMVFMKGDPDEPQCGFSRKMVQLLREEGLKEFGHFDILTDSDVREGLKKFSNWPTYPQVYMNGELQGGLDVLQEMKENGELKEALGLA